MLSKEIVAHLRCPEDRSELTPAGAQLLQQINTAIDAARLTDRSGKVVEQRIDGGLIRADGVWLYPIVDQIPILVQEGAISLQSFTMKD